MPSPSSTSQRAERREAGGHGIRIRRRERGIWKKVVLQAIINAVQRTCQSGLYAEEARTREENEIGRSAQH